mgnify:CR=1 FL=1
MSSLIQLLSGLFFFASLSNWLYFGLFCPPNLLTNFPRTALATSALFSVYPEPTFNARTVAPPAANDKPPVGAANAYDAIPIAIVAAVDLQDAAEDPITPLSLYKYVFGSKKSIPAESLCLLK